MTAFAALLSNLVSNVPAVLVFKGFVAHLLDARHAWLTLAMSSTLAGNLTLLGSVANSIVAERERREVEISFWEYAKAGVPLTHRDAGSGSGCWDEMPFCYTGDLFPQVLRAGEWFLRSGIQNPDGGVARYYRLHPSGNHAVSTEITGYAASTFVFLEKVCGTVGHASACPGELSSPAPGRVSSPPDTSACATSELQDVAGEFRAGKSLGAADTGVRATSKSQGRMLDRARSSARFLMGAWDGAAGAMPFEVSPPQFTYFFDCGIVVRGLLAVWRTTSDAECLDCARLVGDSMARDFRAAGGEFHPILALPGKCPVERDPLRWSRSPGCYQLKSAMAWWDLWEATGDICYRELYEGMREESLRTAPDFLPGHADPRKVVDRLHAYLYFLEALLPMPCAALGEGIERVAALARELAPEFERSDVYAQLLRIRLYADAVGVEKLDRAAAEWEAGRLIEFAVSADDPRMDGGFYFGRSGDRWEPFINPVSAAFALQALALWSGAVPADRHLLI